MVNVLNENTLNYSTRIGDKHAIDAVVGYTYPFLQPISRFTLALYLWRHSQPKIL